VSSYDLMCRQFTSAEYLPAETVENVIPDESPLSSRLANSRTMNRLSALYERTLAALPRTCVQMELPPCFAWCRSALGWEAPPKVWRPAKLRNMEDPFPDFVDDPYINDSPGSASLTERSSRREEGKASWNQRLMRSGSLLSQDGERKRDKAARVVKQGLAPVRRLSDKLKRNSRQFLEVPDEAPKRNSRQFQQEAQQAPRRDSRQFNEEAQQATPRDPLGEPQQQWLSPALRGLSPASHAEKAEKNMTPRARLLGGPRRSVSEMLGRFDEMLEKPWRKGGRSDSLDRASNKREQMPRSKTSALDRRTAVRRPPSDIEVNDSLVTCLEDMCYEAEDRRRWCHARSAPSRATPRGTPRGNVVPELSLNALASPLRRAGTVQASARAPLRRDGVNMSKPFARSSSM